MNKQKAKGLKDLEKLLVEKYVVCIVQSSDPVKECHTVMLENKRGKYTLHKYFLM